MGVDKADLIRHITLLIDGQLIEIRATFLTKDVALTVFLQKFPYNIFNITNEKYWCLKYPPLVFWFNLR